MNTEFDVYGFNLPCGLIHDQKLSNIKIENDTIVLTFDIELYPQNYSDDTVYNQYKDFKHCEMIIEMPECSDPNLQFQTTANSKGVFKGIQLEVDDFVDALNNASSAEFVDCYVRCGEVIVDLDVGFYDAKGDFKKYKNYIWCVINTEASKLKWNWY